MGLRMDLVLIACIAAVGCVVIGTVVLSFLAIIVVEVAPATLRRLKHWLRRRGTALLSA